MTFCCGIMTHLVSNNTQREAVSILIFSRDVCCICYLWSVAPWYIQHVVPQLPKYLFLGVCCPLSCFTITFNFGN